MAVKVDFPGFRLLVPFAVVTLLTTSCRKAPLQPHTPTAPEAAAKPPPVEDNTPLRSVVVLDNHVMASTDRGLFIARKDERKWSVLAIPETMPVGGSFAKQPGGGTRVFYHSTRNPKKDAAGGIDGIYQSDDLGGTWKLVTREFSADTALLHRDGTLYVVTGRAFEPGRRVMMSGDSGGTWRDITPQTNSPSGVHEDPDHPDLAIVTGGTIREYLYQADDRDYHWREFSSGEWNRDHQHDFRPLAYSGRDLHDHFATLSNYFDSPFGDRIRIPAFQISTGLGHYRFRKSEPMNIDIEVSFVCQQPEIRFFDVPGDLTCWMLIRIRPDGRKETVQHSSSGLPGTIQLIGGKQTYRRTVNLAQFGDFSQPGTHRIELCYSNNGSVDKADQAWQGNFNGPVFQITVTE